MKNDDDEEVLRFLHTYKYGIRLSAKERDRVYRRARPYRWIEDGVMKLISAGVMVVVSRPANRQNIVMEQGSAGGARAREGAGPKGGAGARPGAGARGGVGVKVRVGA